jgi:hypothetical protein
MGTPCAANGLRAAACTLRACDTAHRDKDVVEELYPSERALGLA